MKRFFYLGFVLVIFITLTGFTISKASVEQGWLTLASGIEYQEFKVSGPNNVFVARMDRHNLNVTLDSSIATGVLAEGRESVRGMASRYDGAINYWEQQWGARNRVVVAINGYYFDPNSGNPWRGQVQSGWYVKRFDDLENGSGFAWTLDRDAFIGECVYHIAKKQLVKFLASGITQQLSDINTARGSDQLILYTPQFDRNTLTDDAGVEMLVEMNRPTMLLPTPQVITGTIKDIRNGQGSTWIQFDQVVLSASGAAAINLLANAKEGEQVGISQEITSCRISPKTDWTKTYASLGGDFYFLKNSVFQPNDNPQATGLLPRTAIAYSNDFIFFIVVDGRNPGVSVGMSTEELATFAKEILGATYGITEDSGGSSTMVINGRVVNNTTCNFIDCTPPNDPGVTPESTQRPSSPFVLGQPAYEIYAGDVAALVANGMMMVAVEPAFFSKTYVQDDPLTLSQAVNIRLGPGTNYEILNTAQAGDDGVVLDHSLNGVFATGRYWWKVKIGPLKGWISEKPQWPFRFSLPIIYR